MSAEEYAKAVVDTLGFKGKFDLSLDRSNWKYGKKEINYLVLSWGISHINAKKYIFVLYEGYGGSSTGPLSDALTALVGPAAAGMSSSTICRLKED